MSQEQLDVRVTAAVEAALAQMEQLDQLAQLDRTAWRLVSARRLSGGAINQNFLVELNDKQGRTIRWVLRRGQSAGIPGTHGRTQEFALCEFAFSLGLTLPRPLALVQTDEGPVSFFEFCEGQADGRRLMQSMASNPTAARTLTRQLGCELGRLHQASASDRAATRLVDVLGPRPDNAVLAAMTLLEKSLTAVRQPAAYLTQAAQAVLAEGQQLAAGVGKPTPATVCHNDFRLGNLMAHPESGQLTAVLDWEFAAWGDLLADVGWLSAACWRFGGQQPVAGFGQLEDLVDGLTQTLEAHQTQALRSRLPVELAFWQRFAHLRWAIIAAQQGERVVSGDAEALELTITGAMSASLVEPVVSHYTGLSLAQLAAEPAVSPGATMTQPASTADRLLKEAALHLRQHLGAQLSGSGKYSAVMAANAIRLARGRLALAARQAKPLVPASGIEAPFTSQALDDLVADLQVWSFKG